MRNGGDARTRFYVLNNLAALHQEIGHIDEAMDQFRAVIEHLRRSPLTDAQMLAFAHNWYAMRSRCRARCPRRRPRSC